jgi:DNA-binding transcriptional ArsR family regulator
MDDLRRATRFDIAAIAALLAEPARVAMVFALMDGEARPATELAHVAGVSASTGSAHLASLVRGGLVQMQRFGRHRYHRLASETAARALESLSLLVPPPRVTPPDDPARAALRRARTCYRHLAGAIGVALVEAMVRRRLLRRTGDAFLLTGTGRRAMATLGLLEADGVALQGSPCLDWTERRDHVAGPLGVALTQGLLESGWLQRRKQGRSLRVTVEGARGLRDAFGLAVEAG